MKDNQQVLVIMDHTDADEESNIGDETLQRGNGNQNDGGDNLQEDEGDGKKPVKGSIFHIDTSRIHAIPTNDQASELQDLGVSVFDQDEFEKGVLEQVDEAIHKEEAKLSRQRDEKELKNVVNDIRSCRSELRNLQRVAAGIRVPPTGSSGNKQLAKKLMSVVTQKENKAKQLKKLRAKHRTLSARLNGEIYVADTGTLSDDAAVEDESRSSTSAYKKLLSVGDRGGQDASEDDTTAGPSSRGSETEQERLIRLGEMTPFGTFLTISEQQKPKPRPLFTDFEKFLGEKDVATYKKHKVATKWKGTSSANKKGSAASSDDGSILRGLLTPKADSKTSKIEQKSLKKIKSSKMDKSRSTSINDSRGKPNKGDRERMEFEPKYRKKARDEWNSQRSKVKRSSSAMRDLTENVDSDYEDYGNNDEDYDPGNESEQEAAFDDSDYSDEEAVMGRQYARPKKRKYADEIADGTITSLNDLKRQYGVRARKTQDSRISRVRDDATQEQFFRRLKENKRNELRQKQIKILKGEGEEDSENSNSTTAMDSDEEDVELDGGFKIPSKIWRKLYRYQKIGVKWLWELHRQKAGGILGDEMGLGKTIQIIAFLAGLKNSRAPSKGFKYKGLGPVLIVCPATVLHQWVKEFHTWYPEMRVAVLHESGSHSGKKEALLRDIVSCHGTIITSYSNVRIRQEMLLHFNWHYVILDEGHKIRNPDAEVTLACKQFRTPHRLILTGSPMQNNLRELWSLIDFVFPGKLGTLPVFMQQFSVPIVQGGYANASKVQVQTAYKCACILRDSVSPYLLRRMKADVKQALQLPSKNEQVLFCHLTEEQTQVYEDYLASKECNLILRGEYQVFAGLIALRKICNHPDLMTGGPKVFTHQNLTDDQLSEEQKYGYWRRAGKMIVVESLLKLWKEQNHRVLLFSQSKQMLDIIEDFVKDRYSYMRMDGTTTIASRQPLINKYNSDPRIFLFLLTTRVGGLGVNLTGANRVIIYDPDWNPSTDTQARERSWRIGQVRQVTIYRLLTAGSIEEKIYHRQIFKTFLTNRVLKDPRQRRFFKSNDLFELFTLGSAEKNKSTETSAIFAGTGSEVRPGPRALKNASAKAGPVIKLGKKGEDAEKARKRQEREEMVKKELKIKAKREVKMKRKKEAETRARIEEAELRARVKQEPADVDDVSDSSGPRVFQVHVEPAHTKGSISDARMEPGSHGNSSSSSSSHLASLRLQGGEVGSSQNGTEDDAKPGGFFPSAKRLKVTPSSSLWSMSSSSSNLPSSSTSSLSSTQVHSISSSTSGVPTSTVSWKNSSETPSPSSKDKKKKRRDAKLDGHRIPHLAKTKVFVPKTEEEDEATKAVDQDNYVLEKLFKKSGVHSALQHDNIMLSSNPDYVLVENEAERVAKEAANAIKQSRRRCFNASSGIPTWTGNAGGSAGPKPRFGGKSNSRLVDNTSKKETSKPREGKKKLFGGKKKKAFDGDMSTASTLDEDVDKASEMPSSGSLLSNMRARNHLTSTNNEQSDAGSDDELSQRGATPAGTEHDGLMTELVEFIGNHSRIPGQASTDELLRKFARRIETSSSALFRSMLRQVCTFHRTGKEGFWRLKMEFL